MKYKIFTLLLLAIILTTNVFSQPTITKQKDIGGTGDDALTYINLTKDGGLIAGGFSGSAISGQKTGSNKGDYDYWVVKLDSLQHIQWDKTIGGDKHDDLTSIQQTNDGGYILGGYSTSDISGNKTQNCKGYDDYWIVKLDSSGNIQWDKTIGGNETDHLGAITQTSDGGYILGGYSFSDISGDKTQNNKGYDDYWIVKLNGSGNIQWDKTIGGNQYDELNSIQQTSDDGYILGGYSNSNSSGDKTQNSKGDYDYWFVKLDMAGNIQWDKTVGGSAFDQLESIDQTIDGGYILGGYSNSDISGNKTETSKGKNDYWVVKLNSSGHIQWDKTIGGINGDELRSIEQTRDDGYILGGSSFSKKSGDKTEGSQGGEDYWVVKLDKKGVIQWDKTIGGNRYDYLSVIKESKKNHYVLGGYSSSQISGDKTKALKGRGNYDYWVVYLDYNDTSNLISSSNKISLQNATLNSKNFSTYPNPVKDVLYVQSKAKQFFR